MITNRYARALCVALVYTASNAWSQGAFGDAAVITEFQRSVDTYAFQHRQVQRRLGEGADQVAMATGMRAARPSMADGEIFTPIIAAAFRTRVGRSLKAPGCESATPNVMSAEVPRVGSVQIETQALAGCLLTVLPRLPEELEYRVAGVALLLIDTHANMVLDVLHGAFPAPNR